jgi:MFS family permease
MTELRRARQAAYAVYALQGLCFASVISRIPKIQHAHGLSDAAIQLLLLAVSVVAVLGGLLGTVLVGRLGSRGVLWLGQPLLGLSIIAIGTVGPTAGLVVALVIFGIAIGALESAMNAHAVSIEQRYGRSLVNGFFAVWSAAGILGSLAAALTNKLHVPLSVALTVPALAGLAVAAITGGRLLGTDAQRAHTIGRRPMNWRPVLLIGAALGFVYVVDSVVANFGVKYVGDVLHSADAVAPLALTAYGAATLIGRSLADPVVRRVGPAVVARAGAVTGIAGLVLVVAAPHPAVAIAGFALVGLGLCSLAPIAYSAAGRLDPGGRGVAVAAISMFNYLGFVAGIALVAVVQPLAGYRLAFLAPVGLLSAVALLARRFEPSPIPTLPATPVVARTPETV